MTTPTSSHKENSFGNLSNISERRGVFVALGILLMIAGGLAIWLDVFSTLLTVTLLGVFLSISGIFVLSHASLSKQWRGFLMNFLMGLLYLGLGFVLMANPAIGALSLTMLMAAFFIVIGIFRLALAAIARFEHWGWFFASGLLSLLLGTFIWLGWPVSSLFMIGIFVGVELLVAGSTLLALVISAQDTGHLRHV